MHSLLSQYTIEHVVPDGTAATTYALAAGTSDVNSGVVDRANCEEVTFLVTAGTMAASSSLDVKVQQSDDDDGDPDGFSDVAGTSVTQISPTDDDKMVAISVKNATKRYLRLAFTRGDGGNSAINAVHAIKGPYRRQPFSHSTSAGQFASAPELFDGPAEGTA